MEGKKYDADKPRYDLVPVFGLEEVTQVLTFGAKKYDDENWRKVEPLFKRYYSACLRHMESRRKGELIDPESGRHHLAHAICCLMFILEIDLEEAMKKNIKKPLGCDGACCGCEHDGKSTRYLGG